MQVQPERDTRVLLPIGMDKPEAWLLEALDANLLLRALRAPPPGGAPIELVLYCTQVRSVLLLRQRSIAPLPAQKRKHRM